nr:DUF4258 domain-containing protein [Ferruginibacter sp. HRS2-29]
MFFWVKKNQRGYRPEVRPEKIETVVPAIVPVGDPPGFDRAASRIVYSKHARCRMDCRHIDESEVKEILQRGNINTEKIEQGNKGTSYPLEGITHDKQRVRIVFAPHESEMVVVTVIDLDKEWQCDCN